MSHSAAQQASYHPTLLPNGRFTGGQRNFAGRLQILEQHVDFSDKTILDLGCSGGYFTFALAQKALRITAIDANEELINRNRALAAKHNITNVNFICAEINNDTIKSFGHHDVIMFLNVLHHVIARSIVYQCNEETDVQISSLLSNIRTLGETYIFEMGRPDETTTWSKILANTVKHPRKWVANNVFGTDYELTIAKGPAYSTIYSSTCSYLAKLVPPSRYRRAFLRLMRIHQGDLREIYIGRK